MRNRSAWILGLAALVLAGCQSAQTTQVDDEPFDAVSDPARVRFMYDDDVAAIRENRHTSGSKTWQMRYDAEIAAESDRENPVSYEAHFAYLNKKIRVGMTTGELQSALGMPTRVRKSLPPGKGRVSYKGGMFMDPETGKVVEYYYRVKVRLFEPDPDNEWKTDYVIGVVVVVQDGRVRTWHEI